jgi:anaerobic magnesium-protoporphyrin IX monomethyl ester cyclase
MHVTFVNPPYPKKSFQHPPLIPLGIGYLAAVLEERGFEVDIIDCQALNLSYDEAGVMLSRRSPDVVGVTSTTLTYKSALKIVGIAKRACPKSLAVMGGCHVTFWDREALETCPELDVTVRGEGENTMLELATRVEAGEDYHEVTGTTCRQGDEIVRNPDRPYLENLDDLPYPAYHLMPLENFRRYGKVLFPVLSTRGCVYWCDFCSAVRMFGRKYRTRSATKVVDEIEFVHKKYGADRFTFYDDLFTMNHPQVEEICDGILRRNLRITWDCETRLDMVTKELLLGMKEAGCVAVWFSVESSSQKLLDAMGKGFTAGQAAKAFRWAREVGLITVASVLLGHPGETKESAWETVKFVEELDPDDVGYNIVTPYPGIPLTDYVKKMGWLRVYDFDKYDTQTPTFETPMMSMEELREIRENALKRFYLRPNYVFRMLTRRGLYGRSSSRTAMAWFLRTIKSRLKIE